MRRPPKSFCLASKQASPPRTPLEEEEEGSIHFTLYVSHPIASQPGGRGGGGRGGGEEEGGEGTQLLERKRIHKKAAEPIPSHRTRYYRYQALRGRQKGRGAGTESPAALAACKARPMHAGTSWSCSPTYEKEGEYADVSNKNFARDKNAIDRNINRGIKFRARPWRASGPPCAPITCILAFGRNGNCMLYRRLRPRPRLGRSAASKQFSQVARAQATYFVSPPFLVSCPMVSPITYCHSTPSMLLPSRAGSIIELP